MPLETVGYQDMPRSVRLAIKQDLAQRAIDIVTAYHPEPVLGAEIEARITESTPTVDTAAGEPIGRRVDIDDAIGFAIGLAVSRKNIRHGMRGNQSVYSLPNDPVEAGHVTI